MHMKIKRTLIIIFSLVVLALLAGYLLDLPWFSALWASTPGPPPPIEEPEPPPEPTPIYAPPGWSRPAI